MTCAVHCRHPSRVFRGWAACCKCDGATSVLPERPEGGFVEIEEKTHGIPRGPLLSVIDRRVIAHHGARESATHDYHLAADAMAYLLALDKRLSGPQLVVVRPNGEI